MQYDYAYIDDEGICCLGTDEHEPEELDVLDGVSDWIIEQLPTLSECPYCKTPLDQVSYEREFGRSRSRDPDAGREAILGVCSNCAFWKWSFNSYSDGPVLASVGWEACISKERSFSEIPDGCHEELVRAIRRDQAVWHAINPYTLEKLVAAVFRANYQHSEVVHVGRSDDGGVDVLFVNADKTQVMIQVKRR